MSGLWVLEKRGSQGAALLLADGVPAPLARTYKTKGFQFHLAKDYEINLRGNFALALGAPFGVNGFGRA
ncbi:MAG: hypothetical protein AB9869_20160 [Verrucomicrobiia bacterium]